MDPIKSGNNWYAYCANNPLKYVDPTGLMGEGEGGDDEGQDPVVININVYVVEGTDWDESGNDKVKKQINKLKRIFKRNGINAEFNWSGNVITVKSRTKDGTKITSIPETLFNKLPTKQLVDSTDSTKNYSLADTDKTLNIIYTQNVGTDTQAGLAQPGGTLSAIQAGAPIDNTAHEVGHNLGLADRDWDDLNLMGPNTPMAGDRNFDKGQVDFVNLYLSEEF